MNLYDRTRTTKYGCVKFCMYHCLSHTTCTLSSSLFYCLSTVRSKIAREDTEEGGSLEGKRSGGTAKGEIEEVNGKNIYLDGQHVTEFLTMFNYGWYCMIICTCIILIVNLLAE